MKKILLKWILSVVLFVGSIALVEVIFIFLLKNSLLKPRVSSPPQYYSLLPNEVYEKFDRKAFIIPDKYSSEFEYDWTLPLFDDQAPRYQTNFEKLMQLKERKLFYGQIQATKTESRPPFRKIYDVTYSVDAASHRATVVHIRPNSKKIEPRKFILFLGDSFVFGEGVKNENTLPSIFQQNLSTDYSVYNLGYPGFGPQEVLLDLRIFQNDLRWLSADSGLIVYVFIPDQINRVLCPISCRIQQPDVLVKPRVYLENNEIIFKNQIKDSQNFGDRISSLLARSDFVKYLNPVSSQLSEDELKLLETLFKDIKKQVEKNKNIERFVFVNLFPFPEKDLLLSRLEKQNILVIDFSLIPYPSVLKRPFIPIDRHPTSEFNYMISVLLKNELSHRKLIQ